MPSPFPGMNPYLEQPEFWSEVHSRAIVATAIAIEPELNPNYRVAVEKRIYLSASSELDRVITVIEVLSPKNKTAGEGRNAYETKRQQGRRSA